MPEAKIASACDLALRIDLRFLVAEAAIRQLHALVDAVRRQDAAAFARCFVADGEGKIGGMQITGRGALQDACHQLLGRCERIQLIAQPPLLALLDGGEARGRQPLVELARMLDDVSAMTIGVYHDLCAEHNGAWLFKVRHWCVKYRGPPDLSAALRTRPIMGRFQLSRPQTSESGTQILKERISC